MEQMKRYAIYYAPEAGDFAKAAADWLGWDAATGTPCAQPSLPGLPRPAAELTVAPRKYGFHGTLKPPFRLAPGTSAEALAAGVAALAARLAPVTLPGLSLHNLDGFLALTPDGDDSALHHLAAAVVQELDPFRAALTDAEIARRRPERLTARQRELLNRWGYPHVLEQFRFHLTLTDRLPADEAGATAQVLQAHFAPLLPQPFTIRALCLFGEAADGQFHILHRYALSG